MGGDGETGVEMASGEIDGFLGRGGTGVLALARGDEPYATPVSYGYNPETRQFYLRLGFAVESEKRDFVGSTTSARLVAYGPVEGGWTSVIAAGVLEPVEDDDLTAETARVLREADVPLYDAWGDALDRVEFRIYRLTVEELTGRTTAND